MIHVDNRLHPKIASTSMSVPVSAFIFTHRHEVLLEKLEEITLTPIPTDLHELCISSGESAPYPCFTLVSEPGM